MLTQNLLRVPQVMTQCVRSFGQHNKKHIYKNQGKKYEKIRYYPRYVHRKRLETEGERKIKDFSTVAETKILSINRSRIR